MRYQLLSLPLTSLCLMLTAANAETPPPVNHTKESAPTVVDQIPEITREQAMYAMGYAMAKDIGLHWDWSKEDLDAILAGMRYAGEGNEKPKDFNRAMRVSMDIYKARRTEIEAKVEAERKAILAEKKAKADAYFAELEKNDSVKKTESGLRYEIIDAGDPENMPNAKSQVKVKYEGTLMDGTVFDSTDKRGAAAKFTLSHMIKGFTEGLQLIGKGGHIKLYLPAELGYGNRGKGQYIKPGSVLIFDVELMDVMEPSKNASSDVLPGMRTPPPPPPNMTPPPLPENLKPPTTPPPGFETKKDPNSEVE